nr:hypothetical_protein [Oryza brachyantha]
MDNELLPADGSGKSDLNNKCCQNQSGNWNVYVDKPAEVNKWEENSRSNLSWGANHESWNEWTKNYSGWGTALADSSWGNCSRNNNHFPSKNRGSFYGRYNNTYQDSRSISERKRNSEGLFEQRNTKQINQNEGYQRSR